MNGPSRAGRGVKCMPVPLRAGPLSMRLDRGTGMLRDLCWNGAEILRGIYVAIRDQNWNTVQPVFDKIDIKQSPEGCVVELAAICQSNAVHYRWTGHVEISSAGKLVYQFSGRAHSAFRRNRIGFCVLHPDSCAGLAIRVQHVDGDWKDHRFPIHIAPHQPVQNIRRIVHRPKADLQVDVRLDGDTFEMEDQRNWTDASFKTYCTPLEKEFPVGVDVGDGVEQTVTVQIHDTGTRRTISSPSAGSDEAVVVSGGIDAPVVRRLPPIGLGLPPRMEAMPQRVVEMLCNLRIDHLRVDLEPADPHLAARWQAAAAAAESVDCGLEVALRLGLTDFEAFESLTQMTLNGRMRVVRCFVFDATGHPASPQTLDAAAPLVARIFPAAELGGGTDHYFAELNRRRPDSLLLQVVGYSINPQVHAFDDQSLMETLSVQGESVRSAAAFLKHAAIAVTPITLLPRHNPNATDADGPSARLLPPDPPADPRQLTSFVAAWTVGSIASLSATSVGALTYFETTGQRGVLSSSGVAYPAYAALQDVLAFGGDIVRVPSVSDRRAAALRLRQGPDERWVVANLTDQPLTVRLDTQVSLRRVRNGTVHEAPSRDMRFLLQPYGVLTADTRN